MARILYIEIDILQCAYIMEVNFLKKKYQEKWENAYLTVKSSPASGA